MVGHGNAGLASNFIDLAHVKLKKAGILALVLPATFLQGKSWVAARRLLDEAYKDVTIVSIAAIGVTDRAFSPTQVWREVLIIATKKDVNSKTNESKKKKIFHVVCESSTPSEKILEAVTTLKLFSGYRLIRPSAQSRSVVKRGWLHHSKYADR